jgi:hypothetical protein
MLARITLNKSEVLDKIQNPPDGGGRWLLAVDPETLEAKIVVQRGTFVPDVEGHEDLFPLCMALEREDGFIEGGDWLVAETPNRRQHDGWYRSYIVNWV